MDLIPSAAEASLARESSRTLAKALPKKKTSVTIRVGENNALTEVVLPMAAVRLLLNLLGEMAQGNAVTIMPLHAELTSQQGADLLNVSRPFFIKLLDDGRIPFRKVGRHRRIFAKDVIEFKQKHEDAANEAMNELASEAQKLKLGYE